MRRTKAVCIACDDQRRRELVGDLRRPIVATLITLPGWFFPALGFLRMFAVSYRDAFLRSSTFFLVIEVLSLGIGLVITVRSYASRTTENTSVER